MKKVFALAYGVSAYLFFLGTFLYAIGFTGNIVVPKNIDSGPVSSTAFAVIIDALLLSVFAIQHSVMARKGFKQWTRIVSPAVERSTYVIAATLALALILWQWQPIPQVLWDVRGTSGAIVLRGLFFLGWAVLLISTCLVNHFELFGLQQVWNNFAGRPTHSPTFKTPGFYRMVRHPIYLGFVIAFWATPVMTVGHLLFSMATTGYILLGIYFEERDLLASYGQAYRDYSKRVPMLIPFPKRAAKTEAEIRTNA